MIACEYVSEGLQELSVMQAWQVLSRPACGPIVTIR